MSNVRKLGRLPRAFSPLIPHYSALAMGAELPPARPVNWIAGKDIPWGMALNDEIGDCAIAAPYHAGQLWSAYGRDVVITEPDDLVLQAYSEFTGYTTGRPETDQGANIQDVLRLWMTKGLPIREGSTKKGAGRSTLLAEVEVDPRNHDDVMIVIGACGCVDIGFEVPAFLMEGDSAPETWEISARNDRIVGGHSVIAAAADERGLPGIVSWGKVYNMTWAFWDRYVDECYGIVNRWWVDAKGTTPAGLSVDELQKLMAAIKRRR